MEISGITVEQQGSDSEYVPAKQDPSPPSYGVAQEDAPPTYEETMASRIKKAKEESSGNKEFAQNVFKIMCSSALCLIISAIFAAITMALPIAMIVIGAQKKDDCPAEPFIPIYVIVFGACSMCSCCVSLGSCAKKRGQEDNEEDGSLAGRCVGCFTGILSLFLSSWFIAGNVWIYRTYEPSYDDSTADDFCDKTVYLLAFWVTTATYILIGAVICAACLCCCIACCCAASKGNK